MKKWFLLALLPVMLAALLLSPLAGSQSPDRAPVPKEVRDREGRILLRTEKRYRLYYLGQLPLPETLRSLVRRKEALNGSPPYLLAEDLSGEEVRRYDSLDGVILEEYEAPRLIAGPAFAPLLRKPLLAGLTRESRIQLTLAWEVQEKLYDLLKRAYKGSGRLSAGVVDLVSGEVYALASLPEGQENLLLKGLYPAGRDLLGPEVFGEKTGIELPESPGVYWPSGDILATPLQMARALAHKLCGRAPRIHLVKEPMPPVLCQSRAQKPRKSYTHDDGRKWVRLELWPEKEPRFVLILAGEATRGPSRKALAGVFQALAHWLPEEDLPPGPGKGFPDLRGLTLRAALERLPREGLRIDFEGVGRVVRQWPLPGTPWEKVKACRLYLRDAT